VPYHGAEADWGSVITLFDLSAEFWKNYFGSGSALDAYTLTYDRLDWYRRDSEWRFIVCCDSPVSERKKLHPTYKAARDEKAKKDPNRPAALDSLRSLEERMRANGVPVALVEGWEADDVIATLTHQSWPEEVRIIGSEKDFFCLIDDDRVSLIGKAGRVTSAECFEKFGVAPSQMTDWLAIVGDQADDIQGCPNCGPDRAAKLLTAFGNMYGVLDASDEQVLRLPGIGKKTLEGLRSWDPTKALSLVRMRTDLPIKLTELLP
jgi:5'-3' exonuclease